MAFSSGQLLKILTHRPKIRRYWVALSGGLDSMVLLHAMAGLRDSLQVPVLAIHTNHNLQADSEEWSKLCVTICEELEVPITNIDLELGDLNNRSIEAVAREARYAAFQEHVAEGDALLTAHHADDQAETLLLQLLRGAGVTGLSAMPPVREFGKGQLLRPLLAFTRDELREYAVTNDLLWCEDQSNEDRSFDRNYLRHEVIPLLKSRWPGLTTTLSRSAGHCREAHQMLEGYASGLHSDIQGLADDTLPIPDLLNLPLAEQKLLLRHWIGRKGFVMPDENRLLKILNEVVPAREDAMPCVSWSGVEVRRYDDRLWLVEMRDVMLPMEPLSWSGSDDIELPSGLGILRVERTEEKTGIAFDLWQSAKVQVVFRQQGMRCQPYGRAGSRKLKDLFKENKVPPWERDFVPLVLLNGQLAAIGDFFYCEGFAKESQYQVRLIWDKEEG